MSNRSSVWTDPNSFGFSMLVVFLDTYGTEGLQWEPTTIAMEIEADFQVCLSQANFDRLLAAIQILTTDSFYKSLPDFINFCNILSGDTYDPRMWDPAETDEIAWGITEALIIDVPDEEDPFSDEILAYIGKALDDEGIMNPPDILRLAIRDGVNTMRVQNDYTDDPEMFAAIYGAEASKTDSINELIRNRLKALSDQLQGLQLRTGNAKDVISGLLRSSNH